MIERNEILNIRNTLQLSQLEFGNLMWVDTQMVARWEKGKSIPSPREEMILFGLKKIINETGKKIDLVKIRAIAQYKGVVSSIICLVGQTGSISELLDVSQRKSELNHVGADITEIVDTVIVSHMLGEEMVSVIKKSFINSFKK